MKDFMIKLYSNENFPIILFSVIGILLLLFIITLILALNDTKKKKESIVNENKLDDGLNENKEEINNKIVIEDENIPVKENIEEEKTIIEDFSFDDVVLPNTSKVVEEPIKEFTPKSDLDLNKVVNEENIELPKVNDKVNNDNSFNKVINESSILDVKSLNDIPEEEYRIR